jgi:hypothetical protein
MKSRNRVMPRYLRALEDDPTYAMSRREEGKLLLAAAFGVQKSRIPLKKSVN